VRSHTVTTRRARSHLPHLPIPLVSKGLFVRRGVARVAAPLWCRQRATKRGSLEAPHRRAIPRISFAVVTLRCRRTAIFARGYEVRTVDFAHRRVGGLAALRVSLLTYLVATALVHCA